MNDTDTNDNADTALDKDTIALTINYLLPPYLLKKLQHPITQQQLRDTTTHREQIKIVFNALLDGGVDGDDIPQHIKSIFDEFIVECNSLFSRRGVASPLNLYSHSCRLGDNCVGSDMERERLRGDEH